MTLREQKSFWVLKLGHTHYMFCWMYTWMKYSSPHNQSCANRMQRVKSHERSTRGIIIFDPTDHTVVQVVEMEKPTKKHKRKVLKENRPKQLGHVFHDVYQVFCGLFKGRFSWEIPWNSLNSVILCGLHRVAKCHRYDGYIPVKSGLLTLVRVKDLTFSISGF